VERGAGEAVARLATGSQVCGVAFSAADGELVAALGYPGNTLGVWAWGRGERVASVQAHTSRALHLAARPEGEYVATASPDGALKVWRVGPEEAAAREASSEFTPNHVQRVRW